MLQCPMSVKGSPLHESDSIKVSCANDRPPVSSWLNVVGKKKDMDPCPARTGTLTSGCVLFVLFLPE